MFSLEIIITTYNNPQALQSTLESIALQSYSGFSICIADDGSGEPTKAVIESFKNKHSNKKVRHFWQEDKGFRKNRLLNQVIATSDANYLLFIDGDCIACPDFVARHVQLAKNNQFVTGSVIRLTEANTSLVSSELIESGDLFLLQWLDEHGQIDRIGTKLKTNSLGTGIGGLLEIISPVKKVWNGGNTSAWRQDIIDVNGFDESLNYGAEDVELGQRLKNNGISGRHIRYTAPLLHMEHPRGYVDADQIKRNKAYVKEVKSKKLVWATDGIVKDKIC